MKVAAFIGRCALALSLACPGDSAPSHEVTVKFVNGTNGKPMAGLPVRLVAWKGLEGAESGSVADLQGEWRATTDSKGRATFSLPSPLPAQLGFHSLAYMIGCSETLFDTEEVLSTGAVAENLCDRKGKLKGKFSAQPGEAIVFVRPSKWWENIFH